MTDQDYLDGNAAAGLLSEVFAVDVTTASAPSILAAWWPRVTHAPSCARRSVAALPNACASAK